MQKLIDILASGIHDAKNQLFQAEAQLIEAEARHGVDLGEPRYAIEAAARRLSQTLVAYQLVRHEAPLAIQPTVVGDLFDEVVLSQRPHLTHLQLMLEVDCPVLDAWPLDRDLVTDILNNALQNAGRHARSRIRLSAAAADGGLAIRIEDDGPGFASLPPVSGTGLKLAEELARLHSRHQRTGRLQLANGGPLGGARFELWLP